MFISKERREDEKNNQKLTLMSPCLSPWCIMTIPYCIISFPSNHHLYNCTVSGTKNPSFLFPLSSENP